MLDIDIDNEYYADVKGHMLQKLKDCTDEVNFLIERGQDLAYNHDNLDTCLECLIEAERIARNNIDYQSIIRIMMATIDVCFNVKNFDNMTKMFVFYVGRRGQLRKCVAEFTENCIDYVLKMTDIEAKTTFIETIVREVSGKVYAEIPRARLVCVLSKIKEDQGLLEDACDLLFGLQIDVYDTMDIDEKRDIYLEQLRLLISLKRFSMADAITNRLDPTCFEDNFEYSIRYHTLMAHIKYSFDDFVGMAVHYKTFYDSNLTKADSSLLLQALRNIIVLLIMAEQTPKQREEINNLLKYKNLEDVSPYHKLLNLFKNDILINSPVVFKFYREYFHTDLNSTVCSFDYNSEDGCKNWKLFQNRIHEYNIYVLSKHYSLIMLDKAASMLEITALELEEYICGLVRRKVLYARINQVENYVDFRKFKDEGQILDEWAEKINSSLKLVSNITDMITKESEMTKLKQITDLKQLF